MQVASDAEVDGVDHVGQRGIPELDEPTTCVGEPHAVGSGCDGLGPGDGVPRTGGAAESPALRVRLHVLVQPVDGVDGAAGGHVDPERLGDTAARGGPALDIADGVTRRAEHLHPVAPEVCRDQLPAVRDRDPSQVLDLVVSRLLRVADGRETLRADPSDEGRRTTADVPLDALASSRSMRCRRCCPLGLKSTLYGKKSWSFALPAFPCRS